MKKNMLVMTAFLFLSAYIAAQENAAPQEQNNPIEAEETVEQTEKKKSSKNKNFFEVVFPLPILSVETGYPEFLSLDAGVESLFIPLDPEYRTGLYFLFNYSKASDDDFFRFSAGSATGMMGLIEWRAGLGYGFMTRNENRLHTLFLEANARLFWLDLKIVYEIPLAPDDLKEYYYNKYLPVKFKIGLSI